MSHPILYVRVDGYQLSPTVQAAMSEYVVASPEDIGRAAKALGWVEPKACDVLGCVDGFIFEGDEGDIPCPSCGGAGRERPCVHGVIPSNLCDGHCGVLEGETNGD